MSPKKGRFSGGQAYVAFSRVRELCKLHIVNYSREQIRVAEHADGDGGGYYPTSDLDLGKKLEIWIFGMGDGGVFCNFGFGLRKKSWKCGFLGWGGILQLQIWT